MSKSEVFLKGKVGQFPTEKPAAIQPQLICNVDTSTWGDRVARLVERQTQDSMTSVTQVRTQSGAQEKFVSVCESKILC